MPHFFKLSKHPQTHQFEQAAWLDVGRFYYVAFPDGRLYLETYCVWECQEEARGPSLSQGNARPLWACVLHVARRRSALAWLLLSAGPRTGLGRASHAEMILAEIALASSGGPTQGPCAEEARGGPRAVGTQGRLGREAPRAPESPPGTTGARAETPACA